MRNDIKFGWWSIELAPGWFAEEDAECVSFWREEGVGALQISAHKHDSEAIPEDDLRNFMIGELPSHGPLQNLSCGEFVGVGVDYVEDRKFWRKRWVTKGPLLVFITYNSDAHDQALERQAVDQMLASLKSQWKPAS